MPEFNISAERQIMIDSLVEKLPSFRKCLRISQTELARKIGKSRQTVSDIERRTAPMGWDTYIAIIKVFECNGLFEQINNSDLSDRLCNELKVAHRI